jgi:hypothetical protein
MCPGFGPVSRHWVSPCCPPKHTQVLVTDGSDAR